MKRHHIILVESTQSKYEIDSEATTLGELKDEMIAQGIEFNNNHVFKEAVSKTILATDDSILPTNLPWRNTTTSDLIFRVSVPQDKIKSGLSKREFLYDEIRKYDMYEYIKAETGKNFTVLKNDVLEELIHKFIENIKKENKPVECTNSTNKVITTKDNNSESYDVEKITITDYDSLIDTTTKIIDEIKAEDSLIDSVKGTLEIKRKKVKNSKKEESYESLNKMFNW